MIIKSLAQQQTAPKMTLESLKFHLIRNAAFTGQDHVSLGEMIEYLIESLEEADRAHADKAENLLVRIGASTIPALINGLKSPHKTVKAVCAMALIRLGEASVEAVQQFYIRQASRTQRTSLVWIAEFILSELGEELPLIEEAQNEETKSLVRVS